jgi:cell pole-organizing protein PopZ
MRQTSEPSVEEILESIKKVIARDNRTEAARERIRRDGNAAAEIGTAVRWPARSFAQPESRSASVPREVLDLSEVAAQVLDEERGYENEKGRGVDDDEDAPLLPEATTASMRDSLAALAMLSAPGVAPQIVRSGETSLEGLVRDMLRPMLADWLDRNLPPMVEKLVASEIARIVGKKG